MKTGQIFLYFLFVVFLLLDIILLLKLNSLAAFPKVEVVNQLPFLTLTADKKTLLALLEESGFIQDKTVFHLENKVSYKPKNITLVFKEMIPHQKDFIQVFQVHGKPVAGYNISQTTDNSQINFYFSSDYLKSLKSKDLDYAFQSFSTQAILYLGKISKKKQRLDSFDWQEISRLLPKFLKKYDFIQVAKI